MGTIYQVCSSTLIQGVGKSGKLPGLEPGNPQFESEHPDKDREDKDD